MSELVYLMVGIGGGAPSQKHDIRLGDVVVSVPGDGKGGVFQDDFGKTVRDRKFRQTRFLNQPPASLLTAVIAFRGQYEIHGHDFEENINSIKDFALHACTPLSRAKDKGQVDMVKILLEAGYGPRAIPSASETTQSTTAPGISPHV